MKIVFFYPGGPLNQKKTVDFSALTIGSDVHRKPEDITEGLEKHFTERHASPRPDPADPITQESSKVWKLFSEADSDDVELISTQSDLHFNVKEVGLGIQSMKMKNSSGFDKVSNTMIRLLPVRFHELLTQAYNDLFSAAHWGKEWKSARTICLNKCDNPAPTTDQLRPISLLPTFSKVYERLYLFRFNSWSTRMNILPTQQSGARPRQSTTTRVNALLERVNQSHLCNTFTPVIYIDFQQAFDKLWQEGLIVKLSRLGCPSAYLAWIVKYFTERTLRIEYGNLESAAIHVKRGAPQGSCLGPVMYITAHHDLPLLFSSPSEVHAYVDDFAILYTPSIHLNRKKQVEEIQNRMNYDMRELHRYAKTWLQPLNVVKTVVVVHHASAQGPKLNIFYDDSKIEQKKCFKYLGVHLDERLSFRTMVDSQMAKLRRSYSILKCIHRQYPISVRLKNKFFNTYMWPHLYGLATIYVLLAPTSRERISAFYRRCVRLINSLFQCPTNELHQHFNLPTIEDRYRRCLRKRLMNIQVFETTLIDTAVQSKYLHNELRKHYREKRTLPLMPLGRPNKRLVALVDRHRPTFLDLLLSFVHNAPENRSSRPKRTRHTKSPSKAYNTHLLSTLAIQRASNTCSLALVSPLVYLTSPTH